MIKNETKVTIGIANYNGAKTLEKTINSVKELKYNSYYLILVDDHSTDDSCEIVAKKFPDVEIIRHEKNKGVSAVRNTIIKNSKTDLVFLIDNDIILDPDCLSYLVEFISKDNQTAIVTPRIKHEKSKIIYSDGAKLHYICAVIHYNKNIHKDNVSETNPMEVDSGSGGMMMVKKNIAEKLNYFDETYQFGWTDGELMLRATLSGYKCFNIPQAKVYHKQKIWGIKRSYYQLRNRWFIILITYSLRTIIVISPMLLFYEMFLLSFMIFKGGIGDYFKSWSYIIKNFSSIIEKRKKFQPNKVMSDKVYLNSGKFTVDSKLIENKLLLLSKNLLNNFLNFYWELALKLKLIN